jgi:hypothetical protein
METLVFGDIHSFLSCQREAIFISWTCLSEEIGGAVDLHWPSGGTWMKVLEKVPSTDTGCSNLIFYCSSNKEISFPSISMFY